MNVGHEPLSTLDAEAAPGRSLLDDALARLKRNRAAVASAATLVLVALLCVIGPEVTGHAYDQVYREYVRAPPSLSPYPKAEEIAPALEGALKRARVSVGEVTVSGDTVSAPITSTTRIDPRVNRYVERVNLFRSAVVTDISPDGRTAVIEAKVSRFRFLFGTDQNGRDLLTRTLFAGRVSLAIGLLATFVALVIGVSWGATAGYLGGRVDMAMMRVVDVLYALPFIFFVILLVVFFGRNFVLMFVAVGAVEWLDMARIVRGQTIWLKRQEFVEAAEALGVPTRDVIRRHIVPNLAGPVIVYMTLMVPRVILTESFLSFLGLGVQEPMTSWGVLIAEGARNLEANPHMLAFPAVVLVSTLFALNFLGDGLRDALDPRDR